MTLDDITIENMVWVNEFGEAQVAQELVRGVTGNPILYEQAQPLGTPMRLTGCLLYTSPSPRDKRQSRMPSSA